MGVVGVVRGRVSLRFGWTGYWGLRDERWGATVIRSGVIEWFGVGRSGVSVVVNDVVEVFSLDD